ncbi:MAG: hypothetical protein US30_C0001G0041 [Candidatus Moranbacteria bacterium GW2011_GWF2_36_839]|nr:MAG: hypothetical protein US27_C0001G0041 [Candidatus Moranbacteria bacterium GW2011_GWF1_36_78]KKQ17707.1 MAG: hypothetical protein US30_C0001G0041 [Candidatus Moranbacteria bacterium GW2011_GWF2_36_839]HAT73409.1 hypothetical protein [Candidatus Moranbacteria bacterium]HBY10772.1 hypothetical protein [Candidatus Moranbacteria bacterium]
MTFEFIYSQVLFYISILVILFVPGYFLLLAVFSKGENQISKMERFIFSFGLSLIVVDFIAFAYSKLNIPITAISSVLGVLFFSITCFIFYKLKKIENVNVKEDELFSFSKNQFFLLLLLLFLTIFIKTAYLSGTVAPTATDMGHHNYWAKEMSETHKLPVYEGMPDFIIGEHIALSEINMLSGKSFFSAFPVIFLLLINLLSILTVFVLTLRVFKNKNIAILSILFLGVLFAVSSPQAKFVSGGVMGNILGNLLMPMAFYFYLRASELLNYDTVSLFDSRKFLSLGIFSTFGLFYTHHLTAFIFLFIFSFLIVVFLILNYKDLKNIFGKIFDLVFSIPVITTFAIGLIFFFFIFTPNYVRTNAVETAVGTPSKATREGLSMDNIKSSVGEVRLALGFLGLLLLALNYKRKNFGFTLVSAWTAMLFIMSTKPELIFINLPSSRIGNYMSYPLAILSAYGLFSIFNSNLVNSKKIIPKKFLDGSFLIILIFVLTGGLLDSVQAFKKAPDFTPVIETYDASNYLVKNTNNEDVILKDHNYITADSWIKLFFMQGYRYPQSRGYFKRYEDPTKPREMCTLYMISNPAGQDAQKCFQETKTNYILVNPKFDSSQFAKLKNFSKVYNNGDVAVYYKK